MSDKQRILAGVAGLPDSLNWSKFADALLGYLAAHGTPAEFAQFYRTLVTAEDLAEYETMKPEHDLGEVLAEIEAMHAKRESA